MKLLWILCLGLLSAATFAQPTHITSQLKGCSQLTLYRFNGGTLVQEARFEQADNEEALSLTVNYDEAKFRYIGPKPSDVMPVLLKPGETFSISGRCGSLRQAKTINSSINEDYRTFKAELQQRNEAYSTATRAYKKATTNRDSTALEQAKADLRLVDAAKDSSLTKFRNLDPLLGRIASFNTYKSYLTANEGRYANEVDYFVNTYFENVDYDDVGYNDLPWTYEGNRSFVSALAGAIPGEELGDVLTDIYSRWPEGSRAKLFAMSGAFSALLKNRHPAATRMANAIIADYGSLEPTVIQQIEHQASTLKTHTVGAEAPSFSGLNPNGDTINLSDFRGKLLLVDFWASWCGPCRRENPNVVKLYNEFKDQGFEILGVSLDSNRDRWLKAIDDDGLSWPQISDLKGWRNEVAQLYGVSSIPQTVLLDAEGRILARNLKRPSLHRKVAEVLSGE